MPKHIARTVRYLCIVITLITSSIPVDTHAESPSVSDQQVVISSVQTGDSVSARDELIEIWNRSSTPADITGWTLGYFSSTSTPTSLSTQLVKFTSDDPSIHLILYPGVHETIVSKDYAIEHAIGPEAFQFTSTLTYDKSAVVLSNASGAIVDLVGWGANAHFEGTAAGIMSATMNLVRGVDDTNNNLADFSVVSQQNLLYTYGQLVEVVDVCQNIDGLQEDVPEGLVVSGSSCIDPDVCPNIEGLQTAVPAGIEIRDSNCVPVFVAQPLEISELLPNPAGTDTGHEYVEFYNPTENIVDLADYHLEMEGIHYVLPASASIGPHGYYVFDPLAIELILPNTAGKALSLVGYHGEVVSMSPAYEAAPIDESWSYIAGDWQYTNQLTPGQENMPSVTDEEVPGTGSVMAPCSEGWYRSPDTGRCRKIQVVVAVVPCKDGQYRSEETGRCRSIATVAAAALKPCDDDQFRNPETGRCKQIASVDDIVQPCDSGYERNPDTNRCRKVQTAAMPLASYPVQPVTEVKGDSASMIALATVATVAVGYIVWEWRREIVRILRSAVGFLARSK